MKALRFVFAALVCAMPLLAAAQWVYLDKDGHKVFSDKAPPPEVPTNRILKQPGMRAPAVAEAPAAAPAASKAEAAAPKLVGKDKELETRKKQAEAAEAAKKKAQEEQVAEARTDNCNRVRGSKAAFDSGVRIVRTNDKGEREVLDDKQREAETKRLDALIARDCK